VLDRSVVPVLSRITPRVLAVRPEAGRAYQDRRRTSCTCPAPASLSPALIPPLRPCQPREPHQLGSRSPSILRRASLPHQTSRLPSPL
jgi:hypothetical protein